MKIISRILVFGLSLGFCSIALGQGATFYNSGSLLFDYGFPLPLNHFSISGSIGDSLMAGEGVGGWSGAVGDTHFVFILGYEPVSPDSLNGFGIVLLDTVEIIPGSYQVDLLSPFPKMFAFVLGVDLSALEGILDDPFNFDPDSLEADHLYISMTGTIEIINLSPDSISGGFYGLMADVNTGDFLPVQNGNYAVYSEIPVPDWPGGDLSFTYGYPAPTDSFSVAGLLDPISSPQGVGGFAETINDTSIFGVIGYNLITWDSLDWFGIVIEDSGQIGPGSYPVSPDSDLAGAFLFVLGSDLLSLLTILQDPTGFDPEEITGEAVYWGINGSITIRSISEESVWGSFSGMAIEVNTLDSLIVERGTFLLYTGEPPYNGPVWYVTVTGNDTTGDGSPENPFATIQHGIDIAGNGDTVLVADGTYTGTGNKDLDFGGKAILVTSENGAEYTIIDCEGSGRAFYFHSGENFLSQLSGFTIQNGSTFTGGGIYCEHSSPAIADCIISNNFGNVGGGISCADSSSPTIINCAIIHNEAGLSQFSMGGGGLACWNSSSPTLIRCVIAGNSSLAMWGGPGGGVSGWYNSSPTLINCTLTRNMATSGGGVYFFDCSPTTVNTIMWADTAFFESEIGVTNSSLNISYCDVQGGWEGEGNIDADPFFVDPENDDYHLQLGSPCIDAGDPGSPSDPDGTRADMGAFYFDQGTIAHIYFDPSDISAAVGDTFGVSLVVDSMAENIMGMHFMLMYEQSSVAFYQADVGSLLVNAGGTTIFYTNDSSGVLTMDCGLVGSDQGANGPGELLYIQFIAISQDTSDLVFLEADLRDYQNNPIPCVTSDGTLLIGPVTSIEESSNSEVISFQLYQNHPNPFNAQTTIRYALPKSGRVSIRVFNLLGEEVAILVDKHQFQGRYQITWDGKDIASGIYFVTMRAGDFWRARKMVLVK